MNDLFNFFKGAGVVDEELLEELTGLDKVAVSLATVQRVSGNAMKKLKPDQMKKFLNSGAIKKQMSNVKRDVNAGLSIRSRGSHYKLNPETFAKNTKTTHLPKHIRKRELAAIDALQKARGRR